MRAFIEQNGVGIAIGLFLAIVGSVVKVYVEQWLRLRAERKIRRARKLRKKAKKAAKKAERQNPVPAFHQTSPATLI